MPPVPWTPRLPDFFLWKTEKERGKAALGLLFCLRKRRKTGKMNREGGPFIACQENVKGRDLLF